MAVHHRTVTTGTTAAVNIATVLGTTNVTSIIRALMIQADGGNGGIIYFGGSATTLSTTDYGFRVEIPVTTIPAVPLILTPSDGCFSLGDLQILTPTTTDKAHLTIITA